MGLTKGELEALKVKNDSRVARLEADGFGVGIDRAGHYLTLLLEALIKLEADGLEIIDGCQGNTELWVADCLDQMEEQARKAKIRGAFA